MPWRVANDLKKYSVTADQNPSSGRGSGHAWPQLSSVRLQSVAHQRQHVGRLLWRQFVQNQVAHAWFPKLVDVRGNAFHGFFTVWISRKKSTNLIGHVNQIVNVHDVFPMEMDGC